MMALSALMGETTPIRPVARARYKQINPIYPEKPAAIPGTRYPSSPSACASNAPVAIASVSPKISPIICVTDKTAVGRNFLLKFPAR